MMNLTIKTKKINYFIKKADVDLIDYNNEYNQKKWFLVHITSS